MVEIPGIDEMKSVSTSGPPLSVFSIEIAAPTARTVVAGHDSGSYGESSAEWCPFPCQEYPLAEYARKIVEGQSFKADVGGVKTAQDRNERWLGIILIDPWFVADENGRSALESAVEGLPRWVLPVLILAQPDDVRTQELADQVRAILGGAGALTTEAARRGARGVRSLDSFVYLVNLLVTKAGVQYIRHRGMRVPFPSSTDRLRPSHRQGPGPPDSSGSLGETPYA